MRKLNLIGLGLVLTLGLAVSGCETSVDTSPALPNSPLIPDSTTGSPTTSSPGTPQTDNSSQTWATPEPVGPHGKQIFASTADGKPTFGVTYAFDHDVLWLLSFAVDGPDFSQGKPVYLVAWRLWNLETQKPATNWEVSERHADGVYYPGSMAWRWGVTDRATVQSVINSQRDLLVEISLNGNEQNLTATHYLSIGNYCQGHPEDFIFITTGKTGCNQNVLSRWKSSVNMDRH